MGDRRHKSYEREARVKEWRRAWYDGWTEGAIWTLAKTVHALREGGHPGAVGLSVVQRVSSDIASPGGRSLRGAADPGRSNSRSHGRQPVESPATGGNRRQAHEVPPETR